MCRQMLTLHKQCSVQAQVMASLAADATVWAGVSNEADYVTRTTASLQSYITNSGLTGFDIDYEKGMVTNTGRANASWLRVWSQVIYNLKKVRSVLHILNMTILLTTVLTMTM